MHAAASTSVLKDKDEDTDSQWGRERRGDGPGEAEHSALLTKQSPGQSGLETCTVEEGGWSLQGSAGSLWCGVTLGGSKRG